VAEIYNGCNIVLTVI